MLFNSLDFLFIFFPITLLGYYILGAKKNIYHNQWLLFASLLFYSYWNISFLPLLLISIVFNYSISILMDKYVNFKKRIFTFGIVANVLYLMYFKYMDFFISEVNYVLGTNFNLIHIILPLGISFFTITQLVYLFDCYEGAVKEHNFINYSLFVSFFPHLISGPILHHRAMMKQFGNVALGVLNWENMVRGLMLLSIGMVKKVMIADSFIFIVHAGFDNSSALTFADAWLAAISYAFQLYFDFSGYSDMAVGIALMFNIKIPINFNSPFLSSNIVDFWKRWHISLTKVVTDYLYATIVQKIGKFSFGYAMLATIITMTITGIWHGAGMNYAIYGLMHGVAIVLKHSINELKIYVPAFLARISTIVFILCAFVIFRADSLTIACHIISTMFGFSGFTYKSTLSVSASMWGIYLLCLVIVLLPYNSNYFVKKDIKMLDWKAGIVVGILFASAVLSISEVSEFLYFQF